VVPILEVTATTAHRGLVRRARVSTRERRLRTLTGPPRRATTPPARLASKVARDAHDQQSLIVELAPSRRAFRQGVGEGSVPRMFLTLFLTPSAELLVIRGGTPR
jgi:hypothetical protein